MSLQSSFSVATQAPDPHDLEMSPDGTKMYTMETTGSVIYEYDLSTAWDVATATYSGNSVAVSGQDTDPHGLCFSPDGQLALVAGNTNRTIYAYEIVCV